jgi:hypothetical protein
LRLEADEVEEAKEAEERLAVKAPREEGAARHGRFVAAESRDLQGLICCYVSFSFFSSSSP